MNEVMVYGDNLNYTFSQHPIPGTDPALFVIFDGTGRKPLGTVCGWEDGLYWKVAVTKYGRPRHVLAVNLIGHLFGGQDEIEEEIMEFVYATMSHAYPCPMIP